VPCSEKAEEKSLEIIRGDALSRLLRRRGNLWGEKKGGKLTRLDMMAVRKPTGAQANGGGSLEVVGENGKGDVKKKSRSSARQGKSGLRTHPKKLWGARDQVMGMEGRSRWTAFESGEELLLLKSVLIGEEGGKDQFKWATALCEPARE